MRACANYVLQSMVGVEGKVVFADAPRSSCDAGTWPAVVQLRGSHSNTFLEAAQGSSAWDCHILTGEELCPAGKGREPVGGRQPLGFPVVARRQLGGRLVIKVDGALLLER